MIAEKPAKPIDAKSSSAELSQRIAVIKRFKDLLKAQRDRLKAYLDVLEKQKGVILDGSAEDLLGHVEMEEQIVADIFSIQKVIDPLEEMYRSIRADDQREKRFQAGENEIPGLKEILEGLKVEAVLRSEQNKELLSERMAEIRSEIKSLRSSTFARRRNENLVAPAHVDISG